MEVEVETASTKAVEKVRGREGASPPSAPPFPGAKIFFPR